MKVLPVWARSGYEGPTPPLAEFEAAYAEDDNLWWRTDDGHHQNLFEAALEERDELRERLRRLELLLSLSGAGEAVEWGVLYTRSLRNTYPAPNEEQAREWAKADEARLVRRRVYRTEWEKAE